MWMTPGAWRLSSGGMSSIQSTIIHHTLITPPRKIFGGPPGADEGTPEPMQDTQGLSVRERMENERQERLRAPAES